MPTWAPSTKPVIFGSPTRACAPTPRWRPQDDKTDQIWISAIDPTLADPGYSGFGPLSRPSRTATSPGFLDPWPRRHAVRCLDICGDSLDNDCDGTADEADCSLCQAQEFCRRRHRQHLRLRHRQLHLEIADDGVDNDGDGNIATPTPYCNEPK